MRASLTRLERPEAPFEAPNANGTSLREEFIKRTGDNRKLFKKLQKEYPLRGKAFNSGIMTFQSEIIEEDSFKKLLELFRRFGELNRYGEEATINLLFYRQWHMLSMLHNLYPFYTYRRYGVPYGHMQAIIIHFVRETTAKPWFETSVYHEEWLENLRRAEAMDPSLPQEAAKTWTPEEEKKYLRFLAVRRFLTFYRKLFFFADWLVGKAGLCVKKLSPALYEKIRIKKEIAA